MQLEGAGSVFCVQGLAKSALAAPVFGIGGLSLNRCDASVSSAAKREFL